MRRPSYVCDANLVIRLLRWDDKRLSPIAKEVFAKAAAGEFWLYFTSAGIAEIVWVLTSYYEQDRKAVAEILQAFLQRPGIRVENNGAVQEALLDLQSLSVDFLDAYQARLAVQRGFGVMSFDKDFKKWPELRWVFPED